MILGTLVYCLFSVIATVGCFLAVRPLRGDRWAFGSALAMLTFFLGLYLILDARVLSQLEHF